MEMPSSDTAGEFRVVDLYRRAEDKLLENRGVYRYTRLLQIKHQFYLARLSRSTSIPLTTSAHRLVQHSTAKWAAYSSTRDL